MSNTTNVVTQSTRPDFHKLLFHTAERFDEFIIRSYGSLVNSIDTHVMERTADDGSLTTDTWHGAQILGHSLSYLWYTPADPNLPEQEQYSAILLQFNGSEAWRLVARHDRLEIIRQGNEPLRFDNPSSPDYWLGMGVRFLRDIVGQDIVNYVNYLEPSHPPTSQPGHGVIPVPTPTEDCGC